MESYQEKANTLSQRFGISYAAAMKALEESDGDMLDAVIRLEAEGTINRTSANFSTGSEPRSEENDPNIINDRKESDSKESFFDKAVRFFLKSLDSSLCIQKGNREIVSLPSIVFVILLIAAFRIVAIAMIVSLFAGCKYSFRSPYDGSAAQNTDHRGEE